MTITKELVEKLSSDGVSVKEYRQIIAAIGEKVDEIWRYILEKSGRKLEWWAFRNDVSYGRGNGSSGGEFDPEEDKEFIEIIGNYSDSKFPSGTNTPYQYDEGFPTELLWDENWKETVRKNIQDSKDALEKFKQQKKEKAALRKQKDAEMTATIKAKLTPEEVKFLVKKGVK